jgi:hypothetical protein
MKEQESTCMHCNDDIGVNNRGVWVDVNGLSSCAPYAPQHEPVERYVALAVSIGGGTVEHYWVHEEQWMEDIRPLLETPSFVEQR